MRQRGTFLPEPLTYGTTIEFPEKPSPARFVPRYGAFKNGDIAHTGHNKTIGGHKRSTEYDYHEEGEIDTIKHRTQLRLPQRCFDRP